MKKKIIFNPMRCAGKLFIIMLARSSERIFNPMRYAGKLFLFPTRAPFSMTKHMIKYRIILI